MGEEGGEKGEEEGNREGMAVEEVFVPVGAVRCVGELDVETHYCGEELGDEEDGEAHYEVRRNGN